GFGKPSKVSKSILVHGSDAVIRRQGSLEEMNFLEHDPDHVRIVRMIPDRLAQRFTGFFLEGPQLFESHHGNQPLSGKGTVMLVPLGFDRLAPRHPVANTANRYQKVAAQRTLRVRTARCSGDRGIDDKTEGA